jgi:hypothetical protein
LRLYPEEPAAGAWSSLCSFVVPSAVTPGHAASYAALKYNLAPKFSTPERRREYVKAKDSFIWRAMHLADE